MDDEAMPFELSKKIFWILLFCVVQLFIFMYFKAYGSLLVLGVFIFMLVFISKDIKLKKEHENKVLKKIDWYKSKYTLSKEIP